MEDLLGASGVGLAVESHRKPKMTIWSGSWQQHFVQTATGPRKFCADACRVHYSNTNQTKKLEENILF